MATLFSPNNMTSNTAPSPYIVTCSNEWPNNPAYRIFDGVISTTNYWSNSGTIPVEITVYIGSRWKLEYYSLTPLNMSGADGAVPKAWTIQADNNDGNFTVLHSVNQTLFRYDTYNSGNLNISNYYNRYRINITANHSGSSVYMTELRLYGSPRPWPHFSKRNGVDVVNLSKIAGISMANFAKANGITV